MLSFIAGELIHKILNIKKNYNKFINEKKQGEKIEDLEKTNFTHSSSFFLPEGNAGSD